jgi:hypothetical protein
MLVRILRRLAEERVLRLSPGHEIDQRDQPDKDHDPAGTHAKVTMAASRQGRIRPPPPEHLSAFARRPARLARV